LFLNLFFWNNLAILKVSIKIEVSQYFIILYTGIDNKMIIKKIPHLCAQTCPLSEIIYGHVTWVHCMCIPLVGKMPTLTRN
jgi:hypothetical protein